MPPTFRRSRSYTPLAELCREIAETTGANVRLADSTLSQLTVTGSFEERDGKSLVEALCLLTGKKYRYEHDAYIIY